MASGLLITDYISYGSGAPSGAPSLASGSQYALYQDTSTGDIWVWDLHTSAWVQLATLVSGVVPDSQLPTASTSQLGIAQADGTTIGATAGVLSYIGATGTNPSSKLNYVAASDLASGTSVPATTWTDVFANQSFTISNASALVLLSWQFGMEMTAASELAARLIIDSAGTPVLVPIGMANASGSITVNPCPAGAAVIAALSAATHTIKLQVYSLSGSALLYCRPSSEPQTEFAHLQVTQLG